MLQGNTKLSHTLLLATPAPGPPWPDAAWAISWLELGGVLIFLCQSPNIAIADSIFNKVPAFTKMFLFFFLSLFMFI